jgi:hypothetical protein
LSPITETFSLIEKSPRGNQESITYFKETQLRNARFYERIIYKENHAAKIAKVELDLLEKEMLKSFDALESFLLFHDQMKMPKRFLNELLKTSRPEPKFFKETANDYKRHND